MKISKNNLNVSLKIQCNLLCKCIFSAIETIRNTLSAISINHSPKLNDFGHDCVMVLLTAEHKKTQENSTPNHPYSSDDQENMIEVNLGNITVPRMPRI